MEVAFDTAICDGVQLPMGERGRGMSSYLAFGYEYDCWWGLILRYLSLPAVHRI